MAGEEHAPANADSVAERLRRLQQLGVRRGRAGLAPPPAAASHPATAPDLAGHLTAEEVVTPAGRCLVATHRCPPDEARGGWPLAATPFACQSSPSR